MRLLHPSQFEAENTFPQRRRLPCLSGAFISELMRAGFKESVFT